MSTRLISAAAGISRCVLSSTHPARARESHITQLPPSPPPPPPTPAIPEAAADAELGFRPPRRQRGSGGSGTSLHRDPSEPTLSYSPVSSPSQIEHVTITVVSLALEHQREGHGRRRSSPSPTASRSAPPSPIRSVPLPFPDVPTFLTHTQQ